MLPLHQGEHSIAFACCRSSCRRPRGGRGIEPRSEEFQSPVFPVHQLPRTPPPGLEPGAAERQSAMLPLHQGGPHSICRLLPFILPSILQRSCRRSSSDSNSTSGSVLLLRTLSGAIWFAVRFLTEMGWLSISTWPSNCIDLGPHAGSAPSDHFTTQAPFIPAPDAGLCDTNTASRSRFRH